MMQPRDHVSISTPERRKNRSSEAEKQREGVPWRETGRDASYSPWGWPRRTSAGTGWSKQPCDPRKEVTHGRKHTHTNHRNDGVPWWEKGRKASESP